MRLGILGAGRIGAVHARNAEVSKRIELVAVADIVESASRSLSAETGAEARPIKDVIEAADIDAVLIATSTDTHADFCEQAARSGKAIFCEKPVDLESGRVRSCLDIVARYDVPFFTGFNRRFDPSFSALRRRLHEGEIGDAEIVTITSRDPAPPPVAYIERSGGLFRDMMIHDFDMACWILGETPISVFATASCLVDSEIAGAGDVDTAAVILTFESGRLCQISNSRRAVYGYDQRIEVHGSSGLLIADNPKATSVTGAASGGYTSDPAQNFFLERYAEAYKAELESFARFATGATRDVPTGEDGLRALVIAEAAGRSARTGETVAVDRRPDRTM